MRRLLSLTFLIVLAVCVWFGARWFVHHGEIKTTIVFNDAHGIKRGDPVTENSVTVGRVVSVEPLDERAAVTVRLDRDHRRAIVTDSLFTIDHHALVVSNTFAVGAPVPNGAILRAREDGISRWLAKHGGAMKPYLDSAREKADRWISDHDIESWNEKVPEWKREGAASFDKHLDELKKKVDATTKSMTDSNHADEARKLKDKFNRWLSQVRN